MDLVSAAVLGVVQGVAEWLPVSSKTQVMFASAWLLGASLGFAYSLGLFLEGASVLAALLYFRRLYLNALLLRGEGRRWFLYFVVTTAVTAAVGVPLYLAVRKNLSAAPAGLLMVGLGAAVVLNAFVLQRARGRSGLREFSQLSLREMALVGLAQALAVLPGVSRSGATTTTLLLLGLRPDEAFRASFALVPIAGLGATALSYLAEGGALVTAGSVVAMAVGVVVSLVTIEALLRLARSRHVVFVNLLVGALAVAGGLVQLLAPPALGA
ncbi:MAG: undecaprenyl-diphosphate phosphatase [Pyrobaculum sp.]